MNEATPRKLDALGGDTTDTASSSAEGEAPKLLDAPSADDRSLLSIYSVIPDVIRVGEGKYGRCLYATKAFAKGDVIYNGSFHVLDHVDKYKLNVVATDGTLLNSYTLDTLNSFADHVDTPTRRDLYGFDAFMNHSCDPNTWSSDTGEADYVTYAMKDIEVGDELTADYALFDYECDGHVIEVCGCGAPNCRGEMRGFAHLPIEEKVRVLHMCAPSFVEHFKRESKITVIESALPEGVGLAGDVDSAGIAAGGGHVFLVATRDYDAGELIFVNQPTMLPKPLSATYILKLTGYEQHYLLDPDEHFVHREEYVEQIGFDIFMDHSCDPNIRQTYTAPLEYTVVAARPIRRGEKITCDYEEALDNGNVGRFVPSATFQCYCGSARCRGSITA